MATQKEPDKQKGLFDLCSIAFVVSKELSEDLAKTVRPCHSVSTSTNLRRC